MKVVRYNFIHEILSDYDVVEIRPLMLDDPQFTYGALTNVFHSDVELFRILSFFVEP